MSAHLSLLIADRQSEYLDVMVRTGLWGEDPASVAENLIAAGIQRAVEIGAIDVTLTQLPEAEEFFSPFKCLVCEDGGKPPPTLTPGGNCGACGEYCLPF